jgi:AcrR family transcriptional regulator
VSLRQICAAAGQRNTNAVRYQFGDKERLIEAIFEQRQAEMEPVRAAMLTRIAQESVDRDPSETIDALLAIVLPPPLMTAEPEERYNEVKLLASYLNRHRDSGLRHPLDDAPALLPALIAAHQRLFRACALPPAIFDLRIQMVAGLAR